MEDAEQSLPEKWLQRATLRGREYAWRPSDIPSLIRAAQSAGLLSLGGQLQFRFEDTICECYWVEIDVSDDGSTPMSWSDRCARAAEIALTEWQKLSDCYDFLAVGREHFAEAFEQRIALGQDPAKAMCFVWYFMTETDWAAQKSGPLVVTVER